MGKVTISGNAIVITSSVSAEDINLLAKYRPQALQLIVEEDGAKTVDFMLSMDSKGSVGKYGISFNGATRDEEKLATYTTVDESLPESNDEAKEVIADKYGAMLSKLAKIEEGIPAAVEEVKAERDAVIAGIEVC